MQSTYTNSEQSEIIISNSTDYSDSIGTFYHKCLEFRNVKFPVWKSVFPINSISGTTYDMDIAVIIQMNESAEFNLVLRNESHIYNWLKLSNNKIHLFNYQGYDNYTSTSVSVSFNYNYPIFLRILLDSSENRLYGYYSSLKDFSMNSIYLDNAIVPVNPFSQLIFEDISNNGFITGKILSMDSNHLLLLDDITDNTYSNVDSDYSYNRILTTYELYHDSYNRFDYSEHFNMNIITVGNIEYSINRSLTYAIRNTRSLPKYVNAYTIRANDSNEAYVDFKPYWKQYSKTNWSLGGSFSLDNESGGFAVWGMLNNYVFKATWVYGMVFQFSCNLSGSWETDTIMLDSSYLNNEFWFYLYAQDNSSINCYYGLDELTKSKSYTFRNITNPYIRAWAGLPGSTFENHNNQNFYVMNIWNGTYSDYASNNVNGKILPAEVKISYKPKINETYVFSIP